MPVREQPCTLLWLTFSPECIWKQESTRLNPDLRKKETVVLQRLKDPQMIILRSNSLEPLDVHVRIRAQGALIPRGIIHVHEWEMQVARGTEFLPLLSCSNSHTSRSVIVLRIFPIGQRRPPYSV
jgi:hypothetical protein